jgi:hypothetical protein
MKRAIFLLFTLIVTIKVNAFDSIIQIEQNNQINNGSDDYFIIEDNKFNLIISNANDKAIHIFVYHNNQMFTKYQYPIHCEDTVTFHPATALINNNDENNEMTLYINKEMQHNVITPEKRITNRNKSIIKIKDITDGDDRFNGTLYVTVFIDYNGNGIIEQNETGNISIFINKSQDTILFRARVYISTMGYWIKDIQYPVYGREYFYVKITNEYEKERFLELFGKDYYNGPYRTDKQIRGIDYSKYNMYIIFTPITNEIELYNNPHHYNGEHKLIFDININKQSNRGTYVFARNYDVEKSNDRYEIWINNYGQLIKLNEKKLY